VAHDKLVDEHILYLVQSEQIREQAELTQHLKAKGFDVPQATLSRRLKKLNIAKVGGIYKVIESSTPSLSGILSLNTTDSGLIVLRTLPGQANGVAYVIDQSFISSHFTNTTGILGTIAGDDTILVIVDKQENIAQATRSLKRKFQLLND
jgi:transcriptional regulator of arginine metabolism